MEQGQESSDSEDMEPRNTSRFGDNRTIPDSQVSMSRLSSGSYLPVAERSIYDQSYHQLDNIITSAAETVPGTDEDDEDLTTVKGPLWTRMPSR